MTTDYVALKGERRRIRCCYLTLLFAFQGAPAVSYAQEHLLEGAPKAPTVMRFIENPIIRPEMLHNGDGANINGPSLVRVPDWIKNPLGKYYLYFGDHKGKYIRLAYADRLSGPWTIYRPGTLKLDQVEEAIGNREPEGGHVASPDVHVDNLRREIRMYFHGRISSWGHKSGVAISQNGIHFQPRPEPLGEPYFRVFRWGRHWYALTRSGSLVRSNDGLASFHDGATSFAEAVSPRGAKSVRGPVVSMRHTAVTVDGDLLSVFFSRVGDTPESIMFAKTKLIGDWTTWRLSPPVKILEPEMDYEGVALPLRPSKGGYARDPVRELRDPCVYREGDKLYLLYSVAGESGIAIAQLLEARE